MSDPYATVDDLEVWLPAGRFAELDADDAVRVLRRASEVIDSFVTAWFAVDDTTGIPTDETTADAVRDACCAQVEFWLEVGEEHDVTGLAGRQVSIGQLSLEALPPVLAPRAARVLGSAGLLTMPTSSLRWPV
jgi:hypothetical protein